MNTIGVKNIMLTDDNVMELNQRGITHIENESDLGFDYQLVNKDFHEKMPRKKLFISIPSHGLQLPAHICFALIAKMQGISEIVFGEPMEVIDIPFSCGDLDNKQIMTMMSQRIAALSRADYCITLNYAYWSQDIFTNLEYDIVQEMGIPYYCLDPNNIIPEEYKRK